MWLSANTAGQLQQTRQDIGISYKTGGRDNKLIFMLTSVLVTHEQTLSDGLSFAAYQTQIQLALACC